MDGGYVDGGMCWGGRSYGSMTGGQEKQDKCTTDELRAMFYTGAGKDRMGGVEREEATHRDYRRLPTFKFGGARVGERERSRESRSGSDPDPFREAAASSSSMEVLDDMMEWQMRRASPTHDD